jgi:hypothetical protein
MSTEKRMVELSSSRIAVIGYMIEPDSNFPLVVQYKKLKSSYYEKQDDTTKHFMEDLQGSEEIVPMKVSVVQITVVSIDASWKPGHVFILTGHDYILITEDIKQVRGIAKTNNLKMKDWVREYEGRDETPLLFKSQNIK